MRIAIATDAWHPQISGVVTTLTKTIQELEHMGHTVETVHPGVFHYTIACPTYPQIRLALYPKGKLERIFDRFQPDFIHVVTEGPIGVAARFYCRKRKLNFSTAFTTRFDEYIYLRFRIPSAWIFRLLKWFHAAAASVMISSVPLREELESKGFANTVLWPRGVDTDLFRIRSKNFLPGTRPILMYVGRVAVEKNIESFLNLDVKGTKYVVGDGPALEKLKTQYPEVKFVGAKTGENLAEHYAAADVFVFPSLTDTFGIVMLEALACGVPVAAYPVRGPVDIVQNGINGYIDQDLRSAVLKALEINPEDCRQFAKQYSWRKSAEHFFNNLVAVKK